MFFVCVFCLCFFFVFISFIFRKRSNSFFNLFYECFVVLFLFFYEKYSFVRVKSNKRIRQTCTVENIQSDNLAIDSVVMVFKIGEKILRSRKRELDCESS